MNIVDECNLLKRLYESKYYEQTSIRNKIRAADSLKKLLSNYKNHHRNQISFHQKSYENPQNSIKKVQKTYQMEYCNQPIELKTNAYRNFSMKTYKRKAQSETKNREIQLSKLQTGNLQLKAPILHSKKSIGSSIISHRKTKSKLQMLILCQQNKNMKNTAQLQLKPYRTQIGFQRNIVQNKRRSEYLVKPKKIERNQSRDKEQDLMPWSTERDQFF